MITGYTFNAKCDRVVPCTVCSSDGAWVEVQLDHGQRRLVSATTFFTDEREAWLALRCLLSARLDVLVAQVAATSAALFTVSQECLRRA